MKIRDSKEFLYLLTILKSCLCLVVRSCHGFVQFSISRGSQTAPQSSSCAEKLRNVLSISPKGLFPAANCSYISEIYKPERKARCQSLREIQKQLRLLVLRMSAYLLCFGEGKSVEKEQTPFHHETYPNLVNFLVNS